MGRELSYGSTYRISPLRVRAVLGMVSRERRRLPHAKSSDKGYKVAMGVMYPSIIVISFDTEDNSREWKSGHFLIEEASNNLRRVLVCTTTKSGEY